MFFLFYRIYLETVLAQETITKEDITSIESIRQKYRIPLTDHLSILSEIEDGVKIYTTQLEQFGILNVHPPPLFHSQEREIKMLYYNDSRDGESISVLRDPTPVTSPIDGSVNAPENPLSIAVALREVAHA